MAQQNDFDFKEFNYLTDHIPAGLQVFLAQQLLSNAAWNFQRFDNPRVDAVLAVVAEIKGLRNDLKADAAARERKSGSAEIDNGTK
jgi:hypothetical protein